MWSTTQDTQHLHLDRRPETLNIQVHSSTTAGDPLRSPTPTQYSRHSWQHQADNTPSHHTTTVAYSCPLHHQSLHPPTTPTDTTPYHISTTPTGTIALTPPYKHYTLDRHPPDLDAPPHHSCHTARQYTQGGCCGPRGYTDLSQIELSKLLPTDSSLSSANEGRLSPGS